MNSVWEKKYHVKPAYLKKNMFLVKIIWQYFKTSYFIIEQYKMNYGTTSSYALWNTFGQVDWLGGDGFPKPKSEALLQTQILYNLQLYKSSRIFSLKMYVP